MATVLEGNVLAQGLAIALVVSRFNEFLTARLVEGARDAFLRHGGEERKLTMAWVPGSFEIPLVAKKLAASGKFDAVVGLGCVIRGATDHFDYVVSEAAKGIAQASLETGVPVIFGIITAENLEHAIERAGTKQGNNGAKAMLAAIEMANLMKRIKA